MGIFVKRNFECEWALRARMKLPLQLLLQIHFGVRRLRLCLFAMKRWKTHGKLLILITQFGHFRSGCNIIMNDKCTKWQRIISYYYRYYWQSVKTCFSSVSVCSTSATLSSLFRLRRMYFPLERIAKSIATTQFSIRECSCRVHDAYLIECSPILPFFHSWFRSSWKNF